MPGLTIGMNKRVDGGAVLRATRADDSVTWQKHEGARAMFFPLHDLTHFAVETELGFRRGFYGLIAEGWDIEDTTGKGRRGTLPDEAVFVEHLVGWLDAERSNAATWPADQLNADAAAFAAKAGRPAPKAVSEEALERVRAAARQLIHRWSNVAPGESLTLVFRHR